LQGAGASMETAVMKPTRKGMSPDIGMYSRCLILMMGPHQDCGSRLRNEFRGLRED
jgi:hypothetical protein